MLDGRESYALVGTRVEPSAIDEKTKCCNSSIRCLR